MMVKGTLEYRLHRVADTLDKAAADLRSSIEDLEEHTRATGKAISRGHKRSSESDTEPGHRRGESGPGDRQDS
jgi:hypothetical protein